MYLKRINQAIEDLKNGKSIVMLDDEDRENEGDLVYAATFSTPEKVNFLIKEARGVVCVALKKELAKDLKLNLMVKNNSSSHETAFTVSVDAKKAKTGVSADERDMTIKLLANKNTKPSDLVRPGHIFPLIAKDGGVLERTGHTEGTVDLCEIAGLSPISVICEIVKEDGSMARKDDLVEFCKKHNLNLVYVADIVRYRLEHESLIRIISEENVDFLGKLARKINILDHHQNHHIIYTFGDIDKKSYVKFHSVGSDYELFSTNKFEELTKSIEFLQKNSGVLIFLQTQEGGNPFMKEYGIGAQILKLLGITEIELLSSSKAKEFIGISGFGLNIKNQINILNN